MAEINQKEYLKKYLSIGKDGSEKKKKKRKKIKEHTSRIKIIDDNIDTFTNAVQEDLLGESEDAPQIVEIIDDRPPSLRIDEVTKTHLWIPVGVSNDSLNDVKPELKNVKINFNNKNETSIQSPPRKHLKKEIEHNDNSNFDGEEIRIKQEELSPDRLDERRRDSSPPRRERRDKSSSQTSSSDSSHRKNRDVSPPRRERKEKEMSTSKKRKDVDISSPRKISRWNKSPNERNDDVDISPPRNIEVDFSPPRKSKDKDMSPPRKASRWNKTLSPTDADDNEDISPPRKASRWNKSLDQRDDGDNDMSPLRRKRVEADLSPSGKRIDEDMSPPRKASRWSKSLSQREDGDNDMSPLRRRADEDMSPPRKASRWNKSPNQRDHGDNDMSPPRRKRIEGDLSPPRKRSDKNVPSISKKYGDSENRLRSNTSIRPENLSPPRKYHESKKPLDKQTKMNADSNKNSKMLKTLDGKTAGLQNARELVEETKQIKRKEDELFKSMSSSISGANATTIVRDKKTGRIRNLAEETARDLEKKKKEDESKEKYSRWGRGLRQVEDATAKIQDEINEMNKPLARYADDEDLERYLKEQEREGDPMLNYIRKKRKKQDVEEGKPLKPEYMGEFMPNRFGIRPGHRWDGVERSNGYEKRWFEIQNSKLAEQEESYKWSTEDM